MKYRHAVLAGGLAVVASSASAYNHDVVIKLDEACPTGTVRSVAHYSWTDEGFVFDGWLCESLYKGG